MAERPRVPNAAELEAQIAAATAAEERDRASGLRAASASYDRQRRWIMLELTNDIGIGLPVARIPALRHASERALATVEVSPSGSGLRWDALDVDLSVGGLILDAFGEEARRQMGRIAGSITSARKASAARANGSKGGRPPKKRSKNVGTKRTKK